MAAEKPFELNTVDQILAMPDNGDFLEDFLNQHSDMLIKMQQFQMNNGGKVKGKFTITVDYTLDKQLTMQVAADAKFTLPKKPRATAALWTTEDGKLTPQNPRQPSLFGIRDVTPEIQPVRSTL
jgi:hypothetical protein